MSLVWRGREVFDWASDEAFKEVREAAALAEAEAKRVCPVRTGRLKNSITTAFGGDRLKPWAVVGSNVEYAFWVEAGTSRMAARGYLRHAAEVLRTKGWEVKYEVKYLEGHGS